MILARKLFWNACASASSSLGRLFAGVVVARQLGPETMGQFSFLLWMTEILVLIVSIGLPQALMRYLANAQGAGKMEGQKRLLGWATRVYIVVSVVATIGMYFLARRVTFDDTSIDPALAAALSILIALQLWAGLTQALLIGLQRFETYARIALVSSLVLIAGQSLGVVFWGLYGAICGAAAAFAVGAISFLLVANREIIRADTRHEGQHCPSQPSKEFFAYAMYAWLAAVISSVAWGRSELFFVERYAGSQEAGFFSVGLMFSSLILQTIALVSGAFLPHFSQALGAGEHARVSRDYRRLTSTIAIVAFPISLGGLALMPELMRLVFGSSYEQAVASARWLIATGLWSFATVGSAVVYGFGDAKVIARWSLLAAALLILGCFLLTPAFGASGAAAVRWCVNGLMVAIGAYLLRYKYGQPFPARDLVKTFAAASACALVARITADLVGSDLSSVVFGIVLGAFTYLASLRWLRVITPDDAQALRGLVARMPAFGRRPGNALLNFVVPR